jgi:hypothetical protein
VPIERGRRCEANRMLPLKLLQLHLLRANLRRMLQRCCGIPAATFRSALGARWGACMPHAPCLESKGLVTASQAQDN